MKKNIIAVIVTYNPDIERLELNIKAIINQVDSIIIVDNGSENFECIYSLLKEYRIKTIRNYENKGIAYALNKGANYAFNNNFKWMLTLDQDSIADSNMINEFKSFFEIKKNIIDIAIVGPQIIDLNLSNDLEEKIQFKECSVLITSGSLINIDVCNKLGGFKEELFIDGVDFEFCLNVRKNGYRIYQVTKAKLYHELGKITSNKFIGIKIITTNHSPLRRYYYFRNRIYILKKYLKEDFKWVLRYCLSGVKVFLLIIIFENNKYEKIKYSIKGCIDGINNKFGKLKD